MNKTNHNEIVYWLAGYCPDLHIPMYRSAHSPKWLSYAGCLRDAEARGCRALVDPYWS